MKTAASEFVELTATLSQEAKLRILSRTQGKFSGRYSKSKITDDETVAIQLTTEAEQQKEWIAKVRELRARAEEIQKINDFG